MEVGGIAAAARSDNWGIMKKCKLCNYELTDQIRAGAHLLCKPCKSKKQILYQKKNIEKIRKYANERARRIGKVKQYPCESCNKLCYKKYARAFCSDKCRFMAYVQITDNCWIWMGARSRRGYGKLSFQEHKTYPAHRVSYKLFIGPVDDDKFICHSCDNRLCVKPAHLWIGTHKENMLDMIKKDRQHSKLTPIEVYKIRELVEKFGVAQQKIVEQFKISSGTVSSIIHRRIWKHI